MGLSYRVERACGILNWKVAARRLRDPIDQKATLAPGAPCEAACVLALRPIARAATAGRTRTACGSLRGKLKAKAVSLLAKNEIGSRWTADKRALVISLGFPVAEQAIGYLLRWLARRGPPAPRAGGRSPGRSRWRRGVAQDPPVPGRPAREMAAVPGSVVAPAGCRESSTTRSSLVRRAAQAQRRGDRSTSRSRASSLPGAGWWS